MRAHHPKKMIWELTVQMAQVLNQTTQPTMMQSYWMHGMLSVVAMGRGRLVKVGPPAHLGRCHEAFMAACEGVQTMGRDRCQQCVGRVTSALGAAGCNNDMFDSFCPVV